LPQQIPFEIEADLSGQGRIDELVFAKLKQLGIRPANLCSDEVFIRRAYLDVIGTLPTVPEVRDFLRDSDPHKRRALVDRLLQRDEFAVYWTMRWADVLRVKAEFPINLWPNAAQAYHRWIHTCIQANMPYNQFVREMLTASGSNFRVPQVNFYRALQNKEPPSIARTVALTFMGARAEKWPKERLAGMAAFFSEIGYKKTAEWKEEIILFDPDKARGSSANAAPLVPIFPDGTRAKIAADQDPREVFTDWLLDAKNPWLAQALVNRVWYWLLGRGIVEEPDDMRPDNPPQNAELLDWLARELVEAHYDVKHIYGLILSSQTYQLSSIPRGDSIPSAANFAHYPLRRLEAEVLIDALCQITGTTEKYSSLIPEPFTFIPEEQRTIALPDGSITSSFLELFGRPPRDSGMQSERNNRTTAAQRLHLLNSTHIRRKIEQCSQFQALARPTVQPHQVADELYLTILSRFPTDAEFDIVRSLVDSAGNRQRGVKDVAWALINSAEFLHRH
jgi:hypothetical protein